MDKKQRSEEILKLQEKFMTDFKEDYDINKAVSCIHGVDYGLLNGSVDVVREAFEITRGYDSNRYTFAMIKPNAVEKRLTADIVKDIQGSGLKVLASNFKVFSKEEAGMFYKEHEGQDFFSGLVKFMSSGPVITLWILKEDRGDAISALRELMGPYNASDDEGNYPNTLRAKYGDSSAENSIHGSDSPESFIKEIKFF